MALADRKKRRERAHAAAMRKVQAANTRARAAAKRKRQAEGKRRIKRTDVRAATIVRMHSVEGKTYRQIADSLGISIGRVAGAMNELGAKRRPRGRPRNTHPCVATKRDGTPCTEKVRKKGDRCWIHNRKTGGS